ncbi:hypothetical protein CYLTODRAFT_197699 [Cylindrobasidium torrendii FP15055 ss-10]|uniref:BTB domain-containing protein n=1 Tax=Cylindrobasidium torrendii FP15055 ss-10 TaxID=1314674 RepID=A0A0D7AVF9_9AGAR|nr:hypothetical protein CYLTODRAFT_197699 [Cylindrobasidium torrendii FP15055 ss-10]
MARISWIQRSTHIRAARTAAPSIRVHSLSIRQSLTNMAANHSAFFVLGQAEGFRSEDALLDLHRLPASQESLPTLDYQDDSDFEDDDEVDAQGYPFDVSDSPQERLSSTPVDNSKVSKDSEKENSYTDSSTTQNTVLPHIVVPRPEDVEAVMRSQKVLRYGRIKVLSNGAYRTWRAIIHYIYTGTLQFAPLRSTKRSRPSPQACSPKSVYRVADEYGIDTLKQLAFKEIVGNITTKNVFEEVFSYFAHMYPAVHDHGMKVLLKNKSVPAVKKGIMENFHKYGEGAMKPHEKETMNKIMAQLI